MKEFFRKVYKALWDDPDRPVTVSDLLRNEAVRSLLESFAKKEALNANGIVILWTKINDDGLYGDFVGLDQLRAIGACRQGVDLVAELRVRRLD